MIRSVCVKPYLYHCLTDVLTEGNILDESDPTLLHAYALKLEEHLTDKAFNKLRFIFPQSPIDSLKNTEKCVQFLSSFQPVRYHCCPSSCICYTGPYKTLKKCPKCNTDCYKADGTTPQAIFEYLPIIPHLHTMLASTSHATKMQYWSKHEADPTKLTNIFALGLSADGFGPFKCHTKTAWPIILFNYNLPPNELFLKWNIILIGVVPGPKKPCDFDSFLWPLVQELLQLEIGVSAFNAITKVVFLLHAYLIIVFGNIPAVSMIMHMKGHNALSPCHMCTIKGVHIPSS
jgi:Transposase family tnp2